MRTLLLSLTCALVALAAVRAADWPDPEKLPAHEKMPDPLLMFDGSPVKTAEDWQNKRRPELRQLLQQYMYGYLPPKAPVTGKLLREDNKAFDGKATLKEILVQVGSAREAPIHVLLVVPNKRGGPAPVFVGMNFCGNHALVDDPAIALSTAWMYDRYPGVKDNRATAAGRGKQKDVWALEQSIDRGYALATFYSGDVDPDRKEARGGLRPFFDKDEKAGTIAFWAWGIHRVIDHLLTDKDLDSKRIIVVGHSRLGKTALVASAFDDRIALAIPHQAGCGGTAPSRGKVGESVERINTAFPHWFNAAFKKFNKQPERLPFDQNCLTALVAPRPVLFSNAVEDQWANPDGQFEVLQAAEPVWKLLKAGGLASPQRPKENVLSAGKLGYYIRPGKHSMTPEDWKVFLDFADAHLGKSERKSAQRTRKLLLIGQGPDGHPPQTHEYIPGLKVLASCLKDVAGLEVVNVSADGSWKEGPELLARMDGAVLFLSEGAKWLSQDSARLEAFRELARRGGGLTVLHWGMGTKDAGPITNFVDLFGGCHGGPDRKYKVLETKALVAKHPIGRGLRDFTVKDEFYYQLKFAKSPGLEPVLRVTIDGEEHTVAWAKTHSDGGRAFGFSGLHFHDNWKREEYRRLVAQGVLWTLGLTSTAALRLEANEAKSLFDGKTFAGWEGDTAKTWRIEDGCIEGGSLEQVVPRNEFLCTTRSYGDFELKVKFKLEGDRAKVNAGIQFRTKRIPKHHEVSGYQADIGQNYWGALYDESRRNKVLAQPDRQLLEKLVKHDDWNEYTIRCEGARIRLFLNGTQTVDYTEKDEKIERTGIIGLQVHGGAKAKVSYKDIRIQELSPGAREK